ncbi:MAG: glycosyltransferase [Planctomycetes bacterium]|nr:glycosyltransferase [Planctomycetota bacterium]
MSPEPNTASSQASKISVVVPVYNERENIGACLRGLWKALAEVPHEILVCYDFDEDTTLVGIREMGDAPPSLRLVKNTRGRGAANALRAGFDAAQGDVVVTTMGDLSDPPENIIKMAELMRREKLAVVAGSRYMRGGSQTGGPLLKRTLSHIAGVSLNWITGVGTKDATSNFRAYSKEFLKNAWEEDKTGFEIALELTVKAHLQGRGVGEVPSTWTDRTAGESRFRLWKWMPNYLRWWFRAAWRPLLVGLVALIMSVQLVSYVHTNSSPFPMWDDLEYVPLIQPDFHWTADEAWALHNEHRIPLPRWLGSQIYGWTHDIRTVMYFNAALLIGLAFAMMLVARKVRGRTSLVDVVFPFLWLHTGNSENLLMGFQIALTLPTLLVSAVLLIAIAKKRAGLGPIAAIGIGVCVLMLPLCGGMGMAQSPVFVIALLSAVIAALWSKRKGLKSGAALTVLFVAGTVTLFVLYLIGFVYPNNSLRSSDPSLILGAATRVASLAFGTAGKEWWPWAGYGIVLLVLATTALLVWAWFNRREERWRVAALFFCFGATVALVLSIGYGRSAAGPEAGFALRYITLPAPLISTAVFAWVLFGGRIARWAVPAALALTLGIANWTVNVHDGAEFAVARKQLGEDLMGEVARGTPPGVLIERWTDRIYPDEGRLYYVLRLMALMQLKPFDDMPAEARDLYTWWMFNLPPTKIESPVPVSRRFINGAWEVLVVPTGSEITFDVPQSLHHLAGSFGVPPAWQRVMTSNGVRVQVFVSYGPNGARELLVDRTLDPLNVPGDRIGQVFDVEIKPIARKRQVVLSVTWPAELPEEAVRETDWVFFGDTYFR